MGQKQEKPDKKIIKLKKLAGTFKSKKSTQKIMREIDGGWKG
ncbi:MAG: hypothetical protein WC488_00450 [Candidatus Micrarchaeia archaeon]